MEPGLVRSRRDHAGVRTRPPLPAGPYLVVGLARSGEAAVHALQGSGEEVIAVDAGSPPAGGRLREAGVETHLDASGADLVPRAHALVKSPGVPQEAEVVRAARAAGLPVLGELEVGWRLLPNPFLGVTGTNGKTTTTEWLGAMFRAAGRPVAVAGNVGTAVSSLVGALDRGAWVVAECSSFQLEDTEAFAPEGAVLLNLAPDHLNRHGTFEAYTAAKLRIFAEQEPGDVAVVPDQLPLDVRARVVRFGDEGELVDRDGALWWQEERLIGTDELGLPGAHNRLNGMAAAAAALSVGLEADAVCAALRDFAGVPHRLEPVAVHSGVTYVNDSKATNVASTEVALAAFDAPVHLILGGQGKGQDFGALRAPVARRCASVHLIGEDAEAIGEALEPACVPLRRDGDLERAVAAARGDARPGEVVLLSPACASYDQYRDFEARGDHFRALARAVT
jgi:UDP-N-acetylmuramoylalanine--D-glutamate ligase